jgi:hypothetical protein
VLPSCLVSGDIQYIADALQQRQIIVFWGVNACGDGPHRHRLGWVSDEQFMRIGLGAQPAVVALGVKNRRYTVMDLSHQFVRWHRDNDKGALPLSSALIAPVLPKPSETEGRAILYGDGVGLLGAGPLDCPPLEEAIDGHNAPPLDISVAEYGKLCNRLSLGVDGSASTLQVAAPMRDQAPLDQVKRALACLMVLPACMRASIPSIDAEKG